MLRFGDDIRNFGSLVIPRHMFQTYVRRHPTFTSTAHVQMANDEQASCVIVVLLNPKKYANEVIALSAEGHFTSDLSQRIQEDRTRSLAHLSPSL